MIKNKLPSKLIKERLRKIEESAPSDKPFIVFIEKGQKKNEWNVTEQYETLNKKTRSIKHVITDIDHYMKINENIPVLVDYKIDDNNIVLIWKILLQLANEEELEILVNYMIEFLNTKQKNIKFTRYTMKLTQKYKEYFITVNMDRPYNRLNREQLKRLLEIMRKRKVENKK